MPGLDLRVLALERLLDGGSAYQPRDPTLTALAALAGVADTGMVFTGPDVAALFALSPFARTLLDDVDAASMQATLLLGTAARQPYAEGSFTVTATGMVGVVTATALYTQIGKLVCIQIGDLSGTSNATTCAITGIPSALGSAVFQRTFCLVNAAGTLQQGIAQLSGTTLDVYPNVQFGPWTASGPKAVYSLELIYRVA